MKNKLQFIAARPEYCPKPWGLGTCGLKTASKNVFNTLGDGASLGAGHGCNRITASDTSPTTLNRVEGIILVPGRHHNRVTAIQP